MGRRYIKQGQGSTPSTSSAPNVDVSSIVRGVIDDIRQNGDAAVRKYSAKFDKWERPSFKLSQKEIDEAIAACPKQVIEDIKEAQKNVRTFAQAQRETLKDIEVEIQPVRTRPRHDSFHLSSHSSGRLLGTEGHPNQ